MKKLGAYYADSDNCSGDMPPHLVDLARAAFLTAVGEPRRALGVVEAHENDDGGLVFDIYWYANGEKQHLVIVS